MKNSLLKKLILVSKLVVFTMIVQIVTATILIAGDSYGQAKSVYEIYLDLTVKEKSVLLAFEKIEAKTDFIFTYNSQYFENGPFISLSAKNRSLGSVLEEISNKANLRFRRVDENIHVSLKKPNEKAVAEEVLLPLDVEVSGKVTDEQGQPLPGASVVAKGSNVGTATDAEGNYRLLVPEDATLVVTFIGYITEEIPVAGRTVIDVQMVLDVTQLEEMVITGYSVERKKDLLGAVSVADLEATEDVSFPNVMQRLQGRVAGVNINLSAAPGQGAQVFIRGNSTLGNNDPLYIVDGVPIQPFISNDQGADARRNGLTWLNPNDIESIQVLKDASSASIYGSRANNGVIIITTKKASRKGSEVQIRANYGVDVWGQKSYDEVLNAKGRATLLWQKAVNDGLDPNISGVPYNYEWHYDPSLGPGIQGNGVPVLDRIIWPEWIDEDDQVRPAGHPESVHKGTTLEEGTDWFDAIFGTGITQNIDVSLSNVGEKGGARLSLNYFDRDGTSKGSNFKRISARLNSDYLLLSDKLTVGQNITAVREIRHWLPAGSQSGGSPVNRGYQQNPIMPVFTEDGRFTGTPGAGFSLRTNPVAEVFDNRDDRIHDTRIVGNVFLEWGIIKGLTFRTNLGVDYFNSFSRDILRTYQRGSISVDVAQLDIIQTHRTSWVWNNTLTYTKSIDQHDFTILAGTEAVEEEVKRATSQARDFAIETNDFFELDAASGARSSGGNSSSFTLYSLFGKVNYTFKQKYLASFTIRRDGSSRFGEGNRFAVFPAASIGWRIINEPFIGSAGILSDLKLRAAWGQTGNQDIDPNAQFGIYSPLYAEPSVLTPWGVRFNNGTNATSYDIGNNNTGLLPSGFFATQAANPNLKWETQTEINLGLDFGLLDDHLVGSFEVYKKETEDILILPVNINAIGDGNVQWVNGASMEVTGWEASLEYGQQIGDWSYTISANLAHYEDKITELPEALFASFPGNQEQNILGRSRDSFFAFTTDGIFQNQDEVDAHASQTGAAIGQLRYKDLNGDGTINALDQEYHGVHGRPKVQYGVNGDIGFKDFDLSFFFWGMAGRKINDGAVIRREIATARIIEENYGALSLNSWTTINRDTHIPAQTLDASNVRTSDYSWRNGSFLALRQVTLGYRIPYQKIANIRVYASGENLFWITGGSGKDEFTGPGWLVEASGGGAPYPKTPRYTLGVNVIF